MGLVREALSKRGKKSHRYLGKDLKLSQACVGHAYPSVQKAVAKDGKFKASLGYTVCFTSSTK